MKTVKITYKITHHCIYNINIDQTIANAHIHIYKYTSDIEKYDELSGQMKRKKRNQIKETRNIFLVFNWSYMCGHQTTKTWLVSQAALECFS